MFSGLDLPSIVCFRATVEIESRVNVEDYISAVSTATSSTILEAPIIASFTRQVTVNLFQLRNSHFAFNEKQLNKSELSMLLRVLFPQTASISFTIYRKLWQKFRLRKAAIVKLSSNPGQTIATFQPNTSQHC